ncbi:hypothetical protein PVAND_000812 [Polypedilum vanderplanki]|uniref:Uncharacterized protein n=1 Tax=Polypedilum vanderplanki TaxID=319348 RepID=A0A9J6BMD9_POLVA|nr:hypothetical protein PVAND_000812 [Polypedilum vanderplanki]
MSQRTYLIVLTIAIIYFLAICQSADAKRVGCASFGHSCYGGFGKRSLMPSVEQQQNMDLSFDTSHAAPILKVLQHRIQIHPELGDSTEQQQQQQEKEFKMLILSTLSQIIEDTMKKMTVDYESN